MKNIGREEEETPLGVEDELSPRESPPLELAVPQLTHGINCYKYNEKRKGNKA